MDPLTKLSLAKPTGLAALNTTDACVLKLDPALWEPSLQTQGTWRIQHQRFKKLTYAGGVIQMGQV